MAVKSGGQKAWKCPQCGAEVPQGMLLCDCGYHVHLKRRIDDDPPPESAAPESAAPPTHPIVHKETAGGLHYAWLERGAGLFVLFAYLSVVAAAIRLLGLWTAYADIDAPAGSPQASAAAWGFLIDACFILLAGAVSFVVLRAMSDAARALLALTGGLLLRDEH